MEARLELLLPSPSTWVNGTFPLVHSPSCWVAERDWSVEDEHLLLDPIFLDQVAPSHWLLPSAVECHHVIGLELLCPYSIAECSLFIGPDHSYPLSSWCQHPVGLGMMCSFPYFLLKRVLYVSLSKGFRTFLRSKGFVPVVLEN
ncbi:unnamed protein product [Microthlaspi erraticum]|uniref:Uncharacterized protein n=1 Tax=Microthlaspi erraticum TaxID=1685480 RepID=A0A6D2KP29_9BRAS|nr:unnamed protein product [Microthlaspi erraticum]